MMHSLAAPPPPSTSASSASLAAPGQAKMATAMAEEEHATIDLSVPASRAEQTLHFLYGIARDPTTAETPTSSGNIAWLSAPSTYKRTLQAARDLHAKKDNLLLLTGGAPAAAATLLAGQHGQAGTSSVDPNYLTHATAGGTGTGSTGRLHDFPGRASLVRPRAATGRAWKKRHKTVPRGSSPTHFFVDSEGEIPDLDDNLRELMPDKPAVDVLLSGVSGLYYTRDVRPTQAGDSVWVTKEYDESEYCTLDMLKNRVRRPSPLDNWSPLDIALFESGICAVGKDFYHIKSRLLPHKTTAQLVAFYYLCWKHTAHYRAWKAVRRQQDRLRAKQDMLDATQRDRSKVVAVATATATAAPTTAAAPHQQGTLGTAS